MSEMILAESSLYIRRVYRVVKGGGSNESE